MSTNNRYVSYSKGIEVGSEVSSLITIEPSSTKDFYQNSGYIYLVGTSGKYSYSVTREPIGMSSVIYNLSNLVNSDNIYSIFISTIPYIFVIVVSAIGFYIIRKLLFSLSKGKSRI